MNDFKVRGLTEKDIITTKQLDSMSGFGLAPWVADTGPDDDSFGWGLFVNDLLIGYCTIGYADDMCEKITSHPLYTGNSLLVSDVFIRPAYRHFGLGRRMIKSAIEKRWELDGSKEPVFLVCAHEKVKPVYRKAGFEMISSEPFESVMVLVPESNA